MPNCSTGILEAGSSRIDKRIRWSYFLITFHVLLSLPSGRLALAGDGELDPGFGQGGLVTADFFNDIDEAHALAVQRDERIVVAGITRAGFGSFDFALSRFQPDGSLDVSFGTAGKVTTDFDNADDIAWAIALQSDGRIVVAGYSDTPARFSDVALARYLPNGSLDPSFGIGGKVMTDFANNYDAAFGVAVQNDGRIVVAGRAADDSGATDFALARYQSDGSLDTTFGKAGKLTTDFANGFDQANALVLQADGRIVVVGYAVAGKLGQVHLNFGLARYTSRGSLDAGFGIGGKVVTDFANQESGALAVALQKDGRIVAAGSAFNGNAILDFAVARYKPNGSLDRSFSVDGKVTTDISGNYDEVNAVAVQHDGRIVASGFAGPDFGMARFNVDGSLDSTFGSAGTVVTDFQGRFDLGLGMALQMDGKIIAVGRADIFETGTDFGLARFVAGPPPRTLRFFLHSSDVPGTAGGFTMNQSPAVGPRVKLNLSSAPSWLSEHAMTGGFRPGFGFKVALPNDLQLNVAMTFRLAVTNPDGVDERFIAETTRSLTAALRIIPIPVTTPLQLTNQRLKLTISSTARLTFHVSAETYLEATNFSGTP